MASPPSWRHDSGLFTCKMRNIHLRDVPRIAVTFHFHLPPPPPPKMALNFHIQEMRTHTSAPKCRCADVPSHTPKLNKIYTQKPISRRFFYFRFASFSSPLVGETEQTRKANKMFKRRRKKAKTKQIRRRRRLHHSVRHSHAASGPRMASSECARLLLPLPAQRLEHSRLLFGWFFCDFATSRRGRPIHTRTHKIIIFASCVLLSSSAHPSAQCAQHRVFNGV